MFSPLIFSCFLGTVLSANILAVFPHTGKSHFDVFEPLVLELAVRGHKVTVISFFPQVNPVKNYTDISLVGLVPLRVSQVQFEQVESSISDFIAMNYMALDMCEKILTFPKVRELLQSNAKFDLLIVEFFNTDCFLSLVSKYKVPYVAISSANTSPDQDARVGTYAHPAYVSNADLPLDSNMTLAQKLLNVGYTLVIRGLRLYFVHLEQSLVDRLVGGTIPPLDSIAYNVSILLANAHHSMLRPRPLTPGYVEVGGIHIHPPKPINKDLENFLNEASEGAILFSMGSVLQSSSFPADKRQAIMDAFAELPVRVVMKWENSTLPGKPDNVRLSRWLPQRDILAHPKIVAFMGHGGLLSASEAVSEGLPMVLIPMFGDQPNNVAHLAAAGAAVKLDYSSISKETVLASLRAVLYEPRYREKARVLSEQFRDRPMAPLDTAVYWTEYVLRQKGAPHLRSPAVDMPWYQLWLLDVAITLILTLAALLYIVYYLARNATLMVARHLAVKHQDQKTTKKIN